MDSESDETKVAPTSVFSAARLNKFVGDIYAATFTALRQDIVGLQRNDAPQYVDESDGTDYWQSVNNNDNVSLTFSEESHSTLLMDLNIDMVPGLAPNSIQFRQRIADMTLALLRTGFTVFEGRFYDNYQSIIIKLLSPKYSPISGAISMSVTMTGLEAFVQVHLRLAYK